jgi:hypothetical protein
VASINLADGKVLWQQKYQADVSRRTSTPSRWRRDQTQLHSSLGNRLFTLGVTGILNAWDTATGKQLWTRDFSKVDRHSKLFCGTAASPLIGRWTSRGPGRQRHSRRPDARSQSRDRSDRVGMARTWSRLRFPGRDRSRRQSKQIVTMTEGSIVGVDGKTAKSCGRCRFPTNGTRTSARRSGPALISSFPEHAGRARTPTRRADRRQVASDRDLEKSRHRDVHELASFWRRPDLRSFFEEEGTVFCSGREDRRRAWTTEGARASTLHCC